MLEKGSTTRPVRLQTQQFQLHPKLSTHPPQLSGSDSCCHLGRRSTRRLLVQREARERERSSPCRPGFKVLGCRVEGLRLTAYRAFGFGFRVLGLGLWDCMNELKIGSRGPGYELPKPGFAELSAIAICTWEPGCRV